MATPLLRILNACQQYVEDDPMYDLIGTDFPLFAAKMAEHFLTAAALFTVPSNMPQYLFGTDDKPKFAEPEYTEQGYALPADQAEGETEFTVDTALTGYDLASVRLIGIDDDGDPLDTPLKCAYDGQTLTVYATGLKKGDMLNIDYYKDGEFAETLSRDIINILAMCFQVHWQDRFNTNWLDLRPGVEDKSFFVQNRANKENADTNRLESLMRKLAGEMRRYEQSIAIKQTVPQGTIPPVG